MEAGTPRASGLPGRLDHDDAGVSGVHRSRICGGLRPGSGCQANSEGWEPESDDSDPAEGCLVAEGIGLDGSCLRWLFDRIRFILLLVSPACISAISARAFQLTSKGRCMWSFCFLLSSFIRSAYSRILSIGSVRTSLMYASVIAWTSFSICLAMSAHSALMFWRCRMHWLSAFRWSRSDLIRAPTSRTIAATDVMRKRMRPA